MPTGVKQTAQTDFLSVQDLEVTGRIIGPQFSRIFAAIDGLTAHNEVVTLGNSVLRGYDPITDTQELFDLRQPDCVSSKGSRPTSKEVVYMPGRLYDEKGTEYASLWSKFSGLGTIGVFKATPNLVADPENLSVASWSKNAGMACALSSYSWQGRLFTTLTQTIANHAVYKNLAFTGNAVKAIQVTLKKSSAVTDTQVALYDGTAGAYRLDCRVNWTTGAAAISGAKGVIVQQNWYGSGTVVELLLTTDSVTAASTNTFWIVSSMATAAAVCYATAIQAENSAYPTSYTPTSRAAGGLSYPKALGTEGAIEFWAYNWAGADGAAHTLIENRVATSNVNSILVERGADAWYAYVFATAGNNWYVSGPALTSAQFRTWTHFKLVWSVVANNIDLYVNSIAVSTTKTKTGTGIAALTAMTSPLYVGENSVLAAQFDGQITDLNIWPTADTSTTHHTNGVPWYDPTEVTNKYQTVRINRNGIRLHNASLAITDDKNRQIEISNQAGMLARDAAGTVIHDIPNAPILVGAYPMGHYYQFRYESSAYTLVNTATATLDAWQTGVQALTLGCSRISGVRLRFHLWGTGSASPTIYAAFRPNGSTWIYGIDEITPMLGFAGTATETELHLTGVLDVPVSTAFQFDYYLNVYPRTAKGVVIKQMGIWT